MFQLRPRTIHPLILTNATLRRAEKETGLPLLRAFAGLWMVADREGRLAYDSDRLGAIVLPFDNEVNFATVLDRLQADGFISPYQVEGVNYWFLPNFDQYQQVNPRETASALPPPPAELARRVPRLQERPKIKVPRIRTEKAPDAPAESEAIDEPSTGPEPGTVGIPTLAMALDYARNYSKNNALGIVITEQIACAWFESRRACGWIVERNGAGLPITPETWQPDLRTFTRHWKKNGS